jgi:hypothetical protein
MTTVNLLTPTLLSYSLLATLVTIVFIPLGVKLAGKIQRESFDRLLPAIFILIELKLTHVVFPVK